MYASQTKYYTHMAMKLLDAFHLCECYLTTTQYSSYFSLNIAECLRTSEHKVFQNESQVECQLFGVYPEGTVHWFLGSENITESASTKSQLDEEGLFDIRSTLPTQAGTEPYNCSLWIPSSGTYSSHKQLHYSRGLSSGTKTRSRLLLVFILVGLILIIIRTTHGKVRRFFTEHGTSNYSRAKGFPGQGTSTQDESGPFSY